MFACPRDHPGVMTKCVMAPGSQLPDLGEAPGGGPPVGPTFLFVACPGDRPGVMTNRVMAPGSQAPDLGEVILQPLAGIPQCGPRMLFFYVQGIGHVS